MEAERDRDLRCSGDVDDVESLDEKLEGPSSSSASGGTWVDGALGRAAVETRAGPEMGLLGTPGLTLAGPPLILSFEPTAGPLLGRDEGGER